MAQDRKHAIRARRLFVNASVCVLAQDRRDAVEIVIAEINFGSYDIALTDLAMPLRELCHVTQLGAKTDLHVLYHERTEHDA